MRCIILKEKWHHMPASETRKDRQSLCGSLERIKASECVSAAEKISSSDNVHNKGSIPQDGPSFYLFPPAASFGEWKNSNGIRHLEVI